MAPAKPRQYSLMKCYEIAGACLRGPLQCWEKSFGGNFHSGFSDDLSFPTLKGPRKQSPRALANKLQDNIDEGGSKKEVKIKTMDKCKYLYAHIYL